MSDAGSPRYERLTVRALLLGLLMVVALNFAAPYSAFVMHSSHLATTTVPAPRHSMRNAHEIIVPPRSLERLSFHDTHRECLLVIE